MTLVDFSGGAALGLDKDSAFLGRRPRRRFCARRPRRHAHPRYDRPQPTLAGVRHHS